MSCEIDIICPIYCVSRLDRDSGDSGLCSSIRLWGPEREPVPLHQLRTP